MNINNSKKYPNGKLFHTNYGALRILGQRPGSRYVVEFISTGFRTIVGSAHIKNGSVKDYYLPTVYGKGFLGVGKHKASHKAKATREYELWVGILERVYSERYPSYKDIEICEDWHNFQLFCEDLPKIEGYEMWKRGIFQIDKDLKGLKEYSLRGCMFVSKSSNVGEMNGRTKSNTKEYKVISPKGEVFSVFGINEFARTHSLNVANFHKMLTGQASVCLGWKLYS